MVYQLPAQNEGMFKQKKERKRLWRKWGNKERKNKTAYNPYLEKKAKDKPSSKINSSNNREIRHQKRMAKRQLRKSKRQIKK